MNDKDFEHLNACMTTFVAVLHDTKETLQNIVEAATDLKRAVDKLVEDSQPKLTLAERLELEATEAGCDPEQLDCLVIDFKEKEASDDNNATDSEEGDEKRIENRMNEASAINNQGLGAQIKYVLESLEPARGEFEIRQSLEIGERCTNCRHWANPKTMHRDRDGDLFCDSCWDERMQ